MKNRALKIAGQTLVLILLTHQAMASSDGYGDKIFPRDDVAFVVLANISAVPPPAPGTTPPGAVPVMEQLLSRLITQSGPQQ